MKLLKIVVAALCFSFSVQALAAVELKNETFREVIVKDAQGNATKDAKGNVIKKLEPLERAVPGEEVVHVLTYKNDGKEVATNLVLNNPVPKELAYVAGSAKGNNTAVVFSVDGGKKFGALEVLTIKNADGTERPATGSDVTNIRWTVAVAVKSGATGSVTYRSVLR